MHLVKLRYPGVTTKASGIPMDLCIAGLDSCRNPSKIADNELSPITTLRTGDNMV